jgi:hypothetical protein
MPIVLVHVQFGCLFVMMLGSGVGFRPRSPADTKWVCGFLEMCGSREFRTTPVGQGLIKGTQFQLIEIEGIAGDGGVVWLALLFDQIFRVSPQNIYGNLSCNFQSLLLARSVAQA